MTPTEPKACTACAHHLQRGNRHQCQLLAQLFGVDKMVMLTAETADLVSCDRMRRMGTACGPSGALWEPRQA